MLVCVVAATVAVVLAQRQDREVAGRAWLAVSAATSASMFLLNVLIGHRPDAGPRLLWLGGAALCGAALVRGLHQVATFSRPALELARAAVEGLLVACLLVMGLYAWVFHEAASHAMHTRDLTTISVSSIVLSLLTIVASSERNLRLRLAFLVAIAMGLADIARVYLELTGNTMWPLLVVHGLLATGCFWALGTYRISRPDPEQVAYSRQRIIPGTLIMALIGLNLAALSVFRGMGGLHWALIACIVMLLWAREVIRSRQVALNSRIITREANSDALTGVGNRRALKRYLSGLATGRRTEVTAISLDLNGFKGVNDLLGAATGDELLIAVAHHLCGAVESLPGNVFRLSGNEFLIITTAAEADAAAFANRLPGMVRTAAVTVPGVERVVLGCSVGLEHSIDPDGLTEEALAQAVARSGLAMRAAKADGRNKVLSFDTQLDSRNQRRLAVEARLRDLLDGGGSVQVHYQPVMGMATGRMVGAEALARWTDPELGSVPPFEFIEVAEATGLIETLGGRILQTALTELQEAGFFERGLRVSINVSTLQLRVAGFAGQLLDLLRQMQIDPAQVVIEVTESVFLSPHDVAGQTLADIQRAGVGVAVDDFGTGYSSLGYLHRLPVTSLKIDRLLAATLVDLRTQSIVRGVVEMTKGLGLDLVLEGVESADQETHAQRLGVGYAQGWLYAKAVPVSELITLADQLTFRADQVPMPVGNTAPLA